MTVAILFWSGIAITIITGVQSWRSSSDTKRGVVAFPFCLLIAAAVGKYIGM